MAAKRAPTKKRARLTPPEIAETLAVARAKVLAWIRSGELRAINVATSIKGRPRYVVFADDLAAFERSRSNQVEAAAS